MAKSFFDPRKVYQSTLKRQNVPGGVVKTHVHRGGGGTLCARDFKKSLLYPYKGKFWEPLDLYIGEEGGTLCTWLFTTPRTHFAFLVYFGTPCGARKKFLPCPDGLNLYGRAR